jgi:hypothetical protein
MTAIATLDTRHDARHELRPGPFARESLVFMLQLPEADVAAFVYSWVSGEGKAGRAVAVYGEPVAGGPVFEAVDGIAVPADQDFIDWSVGGLSIRHTEPLQRAEVRYASERITLAYDFEAMHPAYAYGSHSGGCPSYLADDRFEQSGRARGVLTIDGREVPFDTFGHRDHSWGTRDWGAAQHWKWIESQAGEDLACHVIEVQAYGERVLRGYLTRDGLTSQVAEAELTYEAEPDLWHTAIRVQARDEAGREMEMRGRTFARIPFPVHPLLHLNEASMAVQIDGQDGVGHVEMAWPPAYLEHVRGAR